VEHKPSCSGWFLGTHVGSTSWQHFCPCSILSSQLLQSVCATLLAHCPLVSGLWQCGGSGCFWKSHCHLDYPGSQAHEDGDQLLLGEPGLLRCLHGCFQYSHQLHLRVAQWVVLWRGLLPLPQLLPNHSCLLQHLLHDSDSCGQVRKKRKHLGVRDWDQILFWNQNKEITVIKWWAAEASMVHGLCSSVLQICP